MAFPARLLERRPDIAGAERRMAAANEQIGIAKAAYYPTLNIAALAGLEGTSLLNWFNWPSRLWAVGGSLSETLFDAGRRKATSETALAGYDRTVANYRQTVLTAFQQVEDNLAALHILSTESEQQRVATAPPRRNHCSSRRIGTPVDSIPICKSLYGRRLLFRTNGMISTLRDGDSKQAYYWSKRWVADGMSASYPNYDACALRG
jgi:hypothetical protein